MQPFMDLLGLTPRPGRLKCVWVPAADGRLESIWVPDCEGEDVEISLPSEAAEPVRKAQHLHLAG